MADIIALPTNGIKVTTFTSNGTFTKSPFTRYATVEVQAAGGGPMGGYGSSAGNTATAAGSGGGTYAKYLYTAAQLGVAAITVTVGVGAAATTAPADGPTTSFGSLLSITGGVKGTGNSNGSGNTVGVIFAALENTSNISGTPVGIQMLLVKGGNGGSASCGSMSTANVMKGGDGGDSFLGRGAKNEWAVCGAGTAANVFRSLAGYGAGSCGYASQNNGNGYYPPNAGSGVVIVTEYW